MSVEPFGDINLLVLTEVNVARVIDVATLRAVVAVATFDNAAFDATTDKDFGAVFELMTFIFSRVDSKFPFSLFHDFGSKVMEKLALHGVVENLLCSCIALYPKHLFLHPLQVYTRPSCLSFTWYCIFNLLTNSAFAIFANFGDMTTMQ